MVLTQENGRKLAEGLDLPELEIELERAIWQVENAIKEKKSYIIGTAAKKAKEEIEKEVESNPEAPLVDKRS